MLPLLLCIFAHNISFFIELIDKNTALTMRRAGWFVVITSLNNEPEQEKPMIQLKTGGECNVGCP